MSGVAGRGEEVAGVGYAQRGKDDDRVAVRVAGAEVVQVDAVGPGEQRQAILVGPVGQELRLLALELLHLEHVRLGVLVRDHLDRRREELVAASVIAMGVRVDDRGDGLVGHRPHLIHDRLTPIGELGVDEDDAAGGDERGGIAAAALDHEEVVADLLDLGGVRLRRRTLAGGDARGTGHEKHSQKHRASHRSLPQKTRSKNQ